MRAVTLALLLLAAGLAGCVGGADTPEATQSASVPGDQPASSNGPSGPSAGPGQATGTSGGGLAAATYEGLDETMVERVTENGTYQAQEACMLGGCFTGDSTRRIDLPAPGPGGLPIHVMVELTTEGGSPLLFLDTADATVYSMEEERSEDGTHSIEAVVLPGSETIQAVINWFGFPPATETRYTLEAHMMAHHDIAFSGVAVSVPLEPGQRVQVENARTDDPISVIWYTPDGVERVRASPGEPILETTLPEDAAGGDHILLVPPGAPDVRILVNGTSATMTPVRYTMEMGDGHEVTSGQTVEWTFDTSLSPLAVGLWIEREQVTSFDAGSATARIDAPNGTVLEVERDCGVFVCFSGGTFTTYYGSQVADPNLAPGTYTATFEQEAANGITVGHYVVSFDL